MAENKFLQDQKPGKGSETPFEKLSSEVSSASSRLRVLEERYGNLRKKSQMTDQSLLDFEKDLRSEIKSLNEDFLDIKKGLSEINENLVLMTSELKSTVKQSDFKMIESYVDMWQPMSFVTRDDLKKVLERLK